MKKNVLLTGGTGFIGRYLTTMLLEKGYSVSILTRASKKNTDTISYYIWDVSQNSIEEAAVLNADYIIHLAGENIADKKWTEERKAEIIASREQSIQLIVSVLKKHDKKLDAFISASGVGIYGALNGKQICAEDTPAANDFLGITCQKWESATRAVTELGIRTVQIRTGLVLGKNDGFLKKLLPVFKFRLGSALGSGEQFMPWIHIHDLCSIYLQAISNPKMQGSYNAAINDGTTNAVFSRTLARVLGYSIWLPNVPAFVLKIVMGEMAVIVLTGLRVSSDKIEKTGFEFKYKSLQLALNNCLTK